MQPLASASILIAGNSSNVAEAMKLMQGRWKQNRWAACKLAPPETCEVHSTSKDVTPAIQALHRRHELDDSVCGMHARGHNLSVQQRLVQGLSQAVALGHDYIV